MPQLLRQNHTANNPASHREYEYVPSIEQGRLADRGEFGLTRVVFFEAVMDFFFLRAREALEINVRSRGLYRVES